MAVSALDSRIFRNLFGTPEIRAIFSDESYTGYLLDTEAALARVQSKLGIIPADAGNAITQACKTIEIDYDLLSQRTEIVGFPVLPLTQQLTSHTPAPHSAYIHWGATTQDIMDTATILQIRSAFTLLSASLSTLMNTLASLAHTHRNTIMPARTHLQHALPCTFGYKCAVYLSSLHRHSQRLSSLQSRCLQVQFAGAVGTLASLCPARSSPYLALSVRELLASELSLNFFPLPWHSMRDNVAEILSFLSLLGGTLGKIAYDIIFMSANEINEVSEPHVPHRGASSTMPQKRNPISSEIVLAASKTLRANAGLGVDAMVVDFERASGPWHLEWKVVSESFVLAVGALHQMNFAMEGLVVNKKSMERNVMSTKGLIVGEAVMMGLAGKMGRARAHDVVYQACSEAIEGHRALVEVLKGKREVMELVGEGELETLCDPREYLGACGVMVDQMLEIVGWEEGEGVKKGEGERRVA